MTQASRRALAARLGDAVGLAWRSGPRKTLLLVALTAVAGVCPVALAWLTKLVLDVLAGGVPADARVERFVILLLMLGGVGLVAALVPHVQDYVEAELRRGVGLLVQDRLFTAVLAFPGLARFEQPQFHDRLRLGRDAGEQVPHQIIGGGFGLIQTVISVSGFLIALLTLQPALALCAVLAAIPLGVSQLALSRHRAELAWATSQGIRRSLFYGNLHTDVRAAKELRLYGAGPAMHARMLKETRAVHQAESALDRRALRLRAILAAVGAVASGAGLAYAGVAALRGGLSVGDIVVFLAATTAAQAAAGQITGQLAEMHQGLLLMGHYAAVVNSEPDLPVPQVPRELPPLRGAIHLRDVWFRYGPDQPWVLQGVDLTIPAGTSVALVGINGAGKSTLVKLLCRFYDPTRGTITWDGVDIRDVAVTELRDRLSVVFQDYMTYDLTATENIGIADPSVLEEPGSGEARIYAAADRAGLDSTLAGLPHGYDTLLSRIFLAGEADDPSAGVLLSGGQWQRVALARAFLRDRRDLLILDEPSAGLDAEAEHAVHESLRRHRHGATSLLISHRLGAVRDADQIVVLSEGRVTECGSHTELLDADGNYARLFALQSSGYRPPGSLATTP